MDILNVHRMILYVSPTVCLNLASFCSPSLMLSKDSLLLPTEELTTLDGFGRMAGFFAVGFLSLNWNGSDFELFSAKSVRDGGDGGGVLLLFILCTGTGSFLVPGANGFWPFMVPLQEELWHHVPKRLFYLELSQIHLTFLNLQCPLSVTMAVREVMDVGQSPQQIQVPGSFPENLAKDLGRHSLPQHHYFHLKLKKQDVRRILRE